MSLTAGVLALAFVALVAGGCRIHKAWEEHLWRRDERDAECQLKTILLAERAREIRAANVFGEFASTLKDIQDLPVARQREVS